MPFVKCGVCVFAKKHGEGQHIYCHRLHDPQPQVSLPGSWVGEVHLPTWAGCGEGEDPMAAAKPAPPTPAPTARRERSPRRHDAAEKEALRRVDETTSLAEARRDVAREREDLADFG